MARSAAAVIRSAPAVRGRTLGRRPALVAVAAFVCLAASCSRQADVRQEQFVGKWKSSRLATPLHMYQNGEWEIKTDEERVLQYGVWQLQGRRMIWSIKMDGSLSHDENAILSVGQQRFELRERDGSVTLFERLD